MNMSDSDLDSNELDLSDFLLPPSSLASDSGSEEYRSDDEDIDSQFIGNIERRSESIDYSDDWNCLKNNLDSNDEYEHNQQPLSHSSFNLKKSLSLPVVGSFNKLMNTQHQQPVRCLSTLSCSKLAAINRQINLNSLSKSVFEKDSVFCKSNKENIKPVLRKINTEVHNHLEYDAGTLKLKQSSSNTYDTGISGSMAGLMLNNDKNLCMTSETNILSEFIDSNLVTNNVISINNDPPSSILCSKNLLNCSSFNSPMISNDSVMSQSNINGSASQSNETVNQTELNDNILPSKYVSFTIDDLQNKHTVSSSKYDVENDDASSSTSSQKTIPFDMEDFEDYLSDSYEHDDYLYEHKLIENEHVSSPKKSTSSIDSKCASSSSIAVSKNSFEKQENNSSLPSNKIIVTNNRNEKTTSFTEITSHQSLLTKNSKSNQHLNIKPFSSLPTFVCDKIYSENELLSSHTTSFGPYDFEEWQSKSTVNDDRYVNVCGINNSGSHSKLSCNENVYNQANNVINDVQLISTNVSIELKHQDNNLANNISVIKQTEHTNIISLIHQPEDVTIHSKQSSVEYNSNIISDLPSMSYENVENIQETDTLYLKNKSVLLSQNIITSFGPYDFEEIKSQSTATKDQYTDDNVFHSELSNSEMVNNKFDFHKNLLMQNSKFLPSFLKKEDTTNDLLMLDKVLNMIENDSDDDNDNNSSITKRKLGIDEKLTIIKKRKPNISRRIFDDTDSDQSQSSQIESTKSNVSKEELLDQVFLQKSIGQKVDSSMQQQENQNSMSNMEHDNNDYSFPFTQSPTMEIESNEIYSSINEMNTPDSSPSRQKDYLKFVLATPSPQKSNSFSKLLQSPHSDMDLENCCKTNDLKCYLANVLSSPKSVKSLTYDWPRSPPCSPESPYISSILESARKRKANEIIEADDDINPQKRQKVTETTTLNDDSDYVILLSDDDSNHVKDDQTFIEDDCNITVKECDNMQIQINRIEHILSTLGTILPDHGLSISIQIDVLKCDLNNKIDYLLSHACSKNVMFDHSYVKCENDNATKSLFTVTDDYDTVNLDFMKLFVKREFYRGRLAKSYGTNSNDLLERIAVLNHQVLEKSSLLDNIQPKNKDPIILQNIINTSSIILSENIKFDDDIDVINDVIEIKPNDSVIDLTTNVSLLSNYQDDQLKIEPVSTNCTNIRTLKDSKQVLLDRIQIMLQLENLRKIAQHYGSNPPAALLQHINKLDDQLEKLNNTLASLNMLKNENINSKINTTKKSNIVQNQWTQLVAEAENVLCAKNKNVYEFNQQKRLTMNRLEHMHNSMAKCPTETELSDTPIGLRVELLDHQKYSMTWMKWRETQKPCGGILADDMGLGKTLTVIALILAKKQMGFDDQSNMATSDDEDDYIMPSTSANSSKKKISTPTGGTLIVCPASIINQWEQEVKQRTERSLLRTYVYHGPKRERNIHKLSEFDMVITTYALVSQKGFNNALFNVNWQRIVLDEAHTIRNVTANLSNACTELKGKFRWALTGTPIQNKQSDIYALLKFLRCKPFDQYEVYKLWFGDNGNGSGKRLHVLMKPLFLRRTKEQLKAKGLLMGLPNKEIKEIKFELETAEMDIYQMILALSRSLFEQFLTQRADRANDDVYYQHYDTNNDNELYDRMCSMNGPIEVKQHHILTVILRLRQICCHPALILSMLENDDRTNQSGEENEDLLRIIIRKAFNNVDSKGTDSTKKLNKSNPAFDSTRPSSKFKTVLDLLEENIFGTNDKAIIVSQWTSVLSMFSFFLDQKKVSYCSITGGVPVNLRNEIVMDFNNAESKTKIMLLSLTAGGVGLNLIGANHVFIIDPHWNPQLENQAKDRIYRVGQLKDCIIYKILTIDTIEEKIKLLQDKKLSIAEEMLSGVKTVANNLTVADMASLFSM